MARIRSIHPGFFTDEAIVSVSAQAQIFYVGIWTQCDDQGAFEWKPLMLKMRLLPASNADASKLLAELETANLIKRVEVGKYQLGLVRNFRKYQRPKKPNAIFLIPAEFRTYVGLSDAGGEIGAQMEEGGGRKEEKHEAEAAADAHARERQAFEAWNDKATELGIRTADLLTTNRMWRLESILAHAGLDGWRSALDRIARAQFLQDGDGWQGWFDLDWLIEGDHFVRFCEGKYDRPRGLAEQPSRTTRAYETFDQRRAREAREAVR